MPYIKKAERLPYDELITRIFLREGFTLDNAQELINLLDKIGQTTIDGHFNYFLTKCFLILNGLHATINLGDFRRFILKVLCAVYQPKYFNYNRAMGMLSCVTYEYQRRHGSRASFLVKTFLDGVIREFYLIVGHYEDQKITENGDVI
jgi:hypothetical protein